MKLYGWEKVGSAEEYRQMIEAEYKSLKDERAQQGRTTGLEEVKLRLFLSLLEKPSKTTFQPSSDDTPSQETESSPHIA